MSFQSPKYLLHFVYFALLTIIATHLILEAGLSYVNESYCERIYLKDSGNLTGEYSFMYKSLQTNCQKVAENSSVA